MWYKYSLGTMLMSFSWYNKGERHPVGILQGLFMVSDTPLYFTIYVTLIFILGCFSSSDLFGVQTPDPLLQLFAPIVVGNSWLGSPLPVISIHFSFPVATSCHSLSILHPNEITDCFRIFFVCSNIL